jgi:hypothetical protein
MMDQVPYIHPLQVDHIVGMAAPEDFTSEVERLVHEHHEKVELDRLVAYQ